MSMFYASDRRKIICILGMIVGVVMIVVGISLLISSKVEPGVGLMEEYFDQFDHQSIYQNNEFDIYLREAYSTVYMAHQITVLCSGLGWLFILAGAFSICYFLYKINDEQNQPAAAPAQSIIKPSENQTPTGPVKAASHTENTWICGNCQTENSKNYAQCKKCGKFKG